MGEEGYSLSGRVFHTIRENILSGKYKCDEELKEKIKNCSGTLTPC